MVITTTSSTPHGQALLRKEKAKEILAIDYGPNFPDNVHDVVRKLYSKRNEKGEAIESLTQTWRRVAISVSIARLKYALKPHEIIQLSLERALENEAVLSSAARYYQAMGE